VLDNDRQAVPELIVERMRCPRCGSPISDGVVEVACGHGHRFAKHDGFVDFSADTDRVGTTERTLTSFGYEWNAFDEVRDEDERFAEIYFRDVDLEGLRSKVGLDAGCGKGRFTRILADHLAAEVALDGSSAVEAAARNLRGHANVAVVQADLRDAPFAPESFDFISSLGVLHHLDDPFEGFTRLVGYLAPQGQILVYLYSRPPRRGMRSLALQAATALRTVTVRIPHDTLKTLSTPIAAVLYGAFVVPGRWGQRRRIRSLADLPMDTYRDKPFRSLVLDTFDRLSAPVEHRYIWKELEPWFARTGLVVDAARDETGWFILAHRP
jgi:SAM-dependent methyltransferase